MKIAKKEREKEGEIEDENYNGKGKPDPIPVLHVYVPVHVGIGSFPELYPFRTWFPTGTKSGTRMQFQCSTYIVHSFQCPGMQSATVNATALCRPSLLLINFTSKTI